MSMDAEQWNDRYAKKELIWGAAPNQFLPPVVEKMRPGRALDLGCGEGRNSLWLAQQGFQVTAVDFSDVAIAKARQLAQNAGVEVDFQVADVTRWQLSTDRFVLVMVFYLQLAPRQLGTVLDVAASAVAPGGKLLFVAHDRANLERGYGGPQDPEVLPTAQSVVADLGRSAAGARLSIDRAGELERSVETADGAKIAIDCLVEATRR
jgi:SAM-dependent methyltransferase